MTNQVTTLEEVCPRCRTSNHQNKSQRLLVNECGHELCEKCVEHLFIRGSAPCPTCKVPLKKSGFKQKRFEDYTVEREVDIRKRVLKDYNKMEEDFSSLREYNDYLEEVEDIIFNLTNNIDLEETKTRIDIYRKENFKIIQKNRVAQSKQEAYLKERRLAEAKEVEERRAHEKECELAEEIEKEERRRKLLDQIASSDRPADEILLLHQEEQRTLTSKSLLNNGFAVNMINKSVSGKSVKIFTYQYEEPAGDNFGPKIEKSCLRRYAESITYLSPGALSGGFFPVYAVQRPIDDAFSGLFMFK